MNSRLAKCHELLDTCHVPLSILDRGRLGSFDIYPAFMDRGEGPYVWDIDGNRYVDWVLGKGPVTLGHAHRGLTDAIAERAARGFQLTMAPREYATLATRLCGKLTGADKAIFLKNGSDAVLAAVRLARAYTDRPVVMTCGYHSWQDPFIPASLAASGTPPSTRIDYRDFGYDLGELERAIHSDRSQIAAVLVTPELGLFDASFLRRAQELARDAGAVFISDEVRCGYHVAIGGASQYAGITPDLYVFSKGMSNGYPISAVAGRSDILEAIGKTFIFGSYFFDALGLVAALTTLDEYEQHGVIDHLWKVSGSLMKGIDEIFARVGIPARCVGPAPMFQMMFEDATAERAFYDTCARHGVLWFPEDNQTASLAHGDEQVAASLDVFETAALSLRSTLYGGGRVASRELSPRAIQRYEARRLCRPGLASRELIHGTFDRSWPQGGFV